MMTSDEQVYYFAGSIRGGREDVGIYNAIISHLKKSGTVLTEHVGDYSLSLGGQSRLSDHYIHDRDLAWLRKSNLVVAETTQPSLGVGYELAMAATYGIPIIALHRASERSLSAMIAGCRYVTVIEYRSIDDALEGLEAQPDLHGTLLHRLSVGNMVIDHETVRRTFPEGVGEIDVICIYEIENGQISKAWFKMGEKRLLDL